MAPAACTGCPSELRPQLFVPMRILRQFHIATGKTQGRDVAVESSRHPDAVKGNTAWREAAALQKVLSSWSRVYPVKEV